MKYLKKFNESRFTDFNEIIDTLKDYISEIEMDYNDEDALSIKLRPNEEIEKRIRSFNIPTSDDIPFYIEIRSKSSSYRSDVRFDFTKLLPTIKSICSYMFENGYKTLIDLKGSLVSYGSNIRDNDRGTDRSYCVSDGNLDNAIIDAVVKAVQAKLTFDKINKEYDL